MTKQLVVMESDASTNGDLDARAKQLEMLAQRIRKNNGEVQKLQGKKRLAKQLVNQVEKALYEESQRISREEMCQLKTRVTTLENEKREISEVLVEVQKRNLDLEVQLIQDKSNHERLLKETKMKIKQLHQQLTKSNSRRTSNFGEKNKCQAVSQE